MAGRPTIFTEALADEICERIAEGESLRSICRDSKMPARTTVFRWLREDEAFQHQYTRAKEEQADGIFDEIVGIADDASPEDVQKARLRIDARKWVAGKLRPKVYGEKTDVNLQGNLHISGVEMTFVGSNPKAEDR